MNQNNRFAVPKKFRAITVLISVAVMLASLGAIRHTLGARALEFPDLPPNYSVKAIGYIGVAHEFSYLGMNSSGAVAGGTFVNIDLAKHKYSFRTVTVKNGDMRDLGALPTYDASRAYAINDKDQVVGFSYRLGPVYWQRQMTACLWERGAIRKLDTLPGYSCSIATAINNRGQIVGKAYTPGTEKLNAACHAFMIDGSKIVDLKPLPGYRQSAATDINQSGQVTGYCQAEDGRSRACWWVRGIARDLGALHDGADSAAYSLNDHGQIIGTSGVNPMRAVMWENGKIHDLGKFPGSPVLHPVKINNSGQFILNTDVDAPHSFFNEDTAHGYLWDAAHGFTRLRLLLGVHSGYVPWKALAINDQGQIAVGGIYKNDLPTVFILSPTSR